MGMSGARGTFEPMSWETYLAWEARQEVKHELVDGVACAMAGGTLLHDRIANAIRRTLESGLAGKACRVQGPDVKVRTGTGNVRYPDALVDCGRFEPEAIAAIEPVAVFEVLSRSTSWLDQVVKLRDYDATPSIMHYVLVSRDEVRVVLYNRTDGRLDHRGAVLLSDRGELLDLTSVGVSLKLPDIYADLPAT